MSSRSPIAVVVPTRDRPDMLRGCLETIRRALEDTDELIVVDSASRDPAVREVAVAAGTTYIRCDEPGASRARNEGWRHASRDIVAFVDDDVQVDADWANALGTAFDRAPDVAFVTGQVGYPPGDRPEFPVAEMLITERFRIDRDWPHDPGHSANLAVRRAALEHVEGFDELLGAGGKYLAGEDKDIIDRLITAGYDGSYEPTARCIHLAWRSRREVFELNWTYGLGSGVRLMKLLKTDRPRWTQQAKIIFWTWGVADMAKAIRWRSRFLTAVVAVRMAGMCLGIVWALPARVDNGHFRQKRR